MRRTKALEKEALGRLASKLDKTDSVQKEFAGKPIEWLAQYGYLFPGVLRELFMAVYNEKVHRVVGLGPRGGGKSYLAAGLGAALFMLKGWNVGIVSGSKEQALRVMEYIQDITGDEENWEYIEDETKTLIRGKRKNWVKASPASSKAIRGLHAKGRPMLLILDEEAEMEPDIVRAALKVVKDAKPSIVLRLSTMHKLFGTFLDLVEHHGKLGYRLFQWDSFDVCTKCTRKCDVCLNALKIDEKRLVKDEYKPEEIAKLNKDLHELYCKGKAHKGAGWIEVDEVRQAFIESPRSWFETEDMAMRPSGEGRVLPFDRVKAAFAAPLVTPVVGAPIWGGVDWGFADQMVAFILQQVGNDLVILNATRWVGVDTDLLIEWFRSEEQVLGATMAQICPDSSHPFNNNLLREAGWDVDEAVFGAYKESGAGRLEYLFGKDRVKFCVRLPEDAQQQFLGWSRGADGKIKKGKDHYCDALLAGTKHLQGTIMGTLKTRAWNPRAGRRFFDLARGRRGEAADVR